MEKKIFGKILREKLDETNDIVVLSRWALKIYSSHCGDIDLELEDILQALFSMEDDPQFEYSEEQLRALANKLIDDEENPLKQINERNFQENNNWSKKLALKYKPYSKLYIANALAYLLDWYDINKVILWARELCSKHTNDLSSELLDILKELGQMTDETTFSEQDLRWLSDQLIREANSNAF